MNSTKHRYASAAFAASAVSLLLAACGSGSSDTSDSVVVAGDVPIAYTKRANSINMNPTDGTSFAAGGDLIIRDASSGSAREHNVTTSITQGNGDVSDPEVSYDGKKIVFALRCPTSNTSTVGGVAACTGAWNIWEYDMTAGATRGSLRRITSSATSDDVDPAYLPGGKGFVFASNRQTTSRLKQGGGPVGGYFAADEYERERVLNLHTMDANGGAITQISVNQSHDRNPVVRQDGDILFSRWDHVGGRNHFKIFRVKPDGTDMFIVYGAHSEGNSFLHPREMDPNGPDKGKLMSDLMPLSRTHEGGGMVLIDAANFSENDTPASPLVPAGNGQKQITEKTLNIDGGLSPNGRITTPFPLWDGTNRVLFASTPCRVTELGVTKLCDNVKDKAALARLGDRSMLAAEIASSPVRDNARPAYSIFMYDPVKQKNLPVAAPPEGFMYTDPIALQKHKEPASVAPASVDATLATAGEGILEVRSVYDTDGLGRMGDPVLTAADRTGGCTNPIPKIAPTDPLDTRAQIPDLLKLKDPANAAYGCSPARFIRVTRALAPPSGSTMVREAIGETEIEPMAILGYAPIEPDGSFKLRVPADVPLGLAVIDSKGRAFQTHTNWIQVRPGETRTCDGCHSPRRGGSINSGAITQTNSAALNTALLGSGSGNQGTLASRRASVDATALQMVRDMIYADVWANTGAGGVARPAISLRYKGNTNPADDMTTTAPGEGGTTAGVINYPDHIQPLWTAARTGGTCVSCHSDPAALDLSGSVAGTGRLQSYERLMVGDPVIDPGTGLPQVRIVEGEPEVVREAGMVNSETSEGDALGLARKSRLAEIMFGETLAAAAAARTLYPTPALNHATMLSAGEKRLLAEWMDLGGKYYNDLFAAGAQQVAKLTQSSFEAQVHPIIMSTCAAGCHQAVGSTNTGTNFRQNRYVLTGSPEGDFNVTLSMISNVCSPATSYLLTRPSTNPHPTTGTAAILPVGSANYNAISNWIAGGC